MRRSKRRKRCTRTPSHSAISTRWAPISKISIASYNRISPTSSIAALRSSVRLHSLVAVLSTPSHPRSFSLFPPSSLRSSFVPRDHVWLSLPTHPLAFLWCYSDQCVLPIRFLSFTGLSRLGVSMMSDDLVQGSKKYEAATKNLVWMAWIRKWGFIGFFVLFFIAVLLFWWWYWGTPVDPMLILSCKRLQRSDSPDPSFTESLFFNRTDGNPLN